MALVVDADDALLTAIVARRSGPTSSRPMARKRPERIGEIARLTGKPVIKAIRVRDARDIAAAAEFSTVASLILYDAKAPETLGSALPGGNGHAFDWGLLEGDRRPAFMLAGRADAGKCRGSHPRDGCARSGRVVRRRIRPRRQGHRPHPEIH